jgi:hypothetical protein
LAPNRLLNLVLSAKVTLNFDAVKERFDLLSFLQIIWQFVLSLPYESHYFLLYVLHLGYTGPKCLLILVIIKQLEHVWLVLLLLFIDCSIVLVETEVGAGLTLIDVFLEFYAVSPVISKARDF